MADDEPAFCPSFPSRTAQGGCIGWPGFEARDLLRDATYSIGASSVGVMNDHLFPGAGGIGFSLSCVYVVCGVASVGILTCGRKAFAGSVVPVEAPALRASHLFP